MSRLALAPDAAGPTGSIYRVVELPVSVEVPDLRELHYRDVSKEERIRIVQQSRQVQGTARGLCRLGAPDGRVDPECVERISRRIAEKVAV